MQEIVIPFGISLLIFVYWVIKNWNKLKKYEPQIHFISSAITVASILLAIYTFYSEQSRIEKTELENQKVLLYALRDELNTNIELAQNISDTEDRLLKTFGVPLNRFSTITTIEVINKGNIGDLQFKTDLRKVYNRMVTVNTILDGLPIFIPLTKEQTEIYFSLKKERAEDIIKENEEIKLFLNHLIPETDSLIQSLENETITPHSRR
jgi:hypothetical protein